MQQRLSDYDYELPAELIAQTPLADRSASRLLHVGRTLVDRNFRDLPDLLSPGDVLVFNDSRVIPARLRARKESGGQVEILLERMRGDREAVVMLRASKKTATGSRLRLEAPQAAYGSAESAAPPVWVEVLGRDPEHDDRFLLRFDRPVNDILSVFGEVPLPPYITHRPGPEDTQRYQTVYAREPGSVAAPTAGLHFDDAVLAALDARGIRRAMVTLHVGSGTFAPVRSDDITTHRMHAEWCEIPPATAQLIAQARQQGRRVIAVGTTSLRTLESGAIDDAPSRVRSGAWETDLFIRPGYRFKVVDGLLTNFHLPRSTLLMLVAAFVGYERMREAYAHAVASRYRFFSYGDAMLCLPDAEGP
jgi:S-adenosylmethionine:tRNA ribosyltransferase-isomerase